MLRLRWSRSGGGDTILRDCLEHGNIKDYFKSDVSLTSAEPIAYALFNLTDGSLAMVSETTEYDVHQCGGGEPVLYDDWQLWKDAVNALNLQYVEWPTTPGNIASSNEFTVPPVPNQGMGNLLTWESSKTGFPFTFHLYGPESGTNGLVYKDYFAVIVDQERSISIGDTRSDWDRDNDDFEVKITKWDSNCRVFAIGITVGHNGQEDAEFTEVSGLNGLYKKFAKDPNNPLAKYAPACRTSIGFIGVVSKVALNKLFFDEHHTTDNIFVRDPCFGYLE